jgi:hypothetical protein
MKEYRSLVLIIIAIFAITLIGAYYSPTFEQQRNWLELFMLLGAVLFIFSALVIFATIGFGSFAIYAALFMAAVMGIYGIEGAFVVAFLSYFTWGFVFAMELLLFYNGLRSAREWFKKRYTYKTFRYEYYAFYPMLFLTYLFLEFIPSIVYRESFLKFRPSRALEAMKEVLA